MRHRVDAMHDVGRWAELSSARVPARLSGVRERRVAALHVNVLGAFRVERPDAAGPVSEWQRRGAKMLTKLLATCPEHALHREQIVELLWPGVEMDSALNSLAKALHAVRHAFEPDLPPRAVSAYVRTSDSMVSLAMEHVLIDADRFQQLAEQALLAVDVAACEHALAAYGGELLPEDRYADWCNERRGFLAELRVRLLLELAEAYDARGSYNLAADRLREVLREDPAREAVHRRLMRLYVQMGMPDQVVRQFQLCEFALRSELDLSPQDETLSLVKEVLQSQVSVQPARPPAKPPDQRRSTLREQPREDNAADRPFVGRSHLIDAVYDTLAASKPTGEGMIVVSGEAGVGKTRFLEELAADAKRRGVAMLWGGTGAHATHFSCGPFAVALEGYAASRSEDERDELAHRYPVLARFVPSLGLGAHVPPLAADPGDDHLGLLTEIVKLLTDLGRSQPVLVVLGDLHDVDPFSLDLVRYLAHLAARRPWLLIAAVREEELVAASELRRMLAAMLRERLCRKLELHCLSADECSELLRAAVPAGSVDRDLLEHAYSQSRGNPLLVLELLRELTNAREPTLSGGRRRSHRRGDRRPFLGSLEVTRLAHVDGTTRRVLELVAAANVGAISLRDLRAGAGSLEPPVSNAPLLDALDRGLELRLLEERGDGYGFRHPLIGTALYEGLARHRREQLHAALSGTNAGRGLECSCGTCAVCSESSRP
jgi:DNA-binding SARP family transcriptional activator